MVVRDVRLYGAQGNGTVDDHDAIRRALDDLIADGGGALYFPAGCYAIGLHEPLAGLRLEPGSPPVTMYGDGAGASTLRMLGGDYDGRGDFYLLRVESADFAIRHLTLDGNRANVLNAKEQTHLLQIQNAHRVRVLDVEFRDARSDGIRILGTSEEVYNEDLSIETCTFRGNGRSGITCQRAFRDTRIVGCHFVDTNDQDIDFEPSGVSAPRRIVIAGNTMRRSVASLAVALSGISGLDRLTDVVFVDNVIKGGAVFGTDLVDVVIRGNRIDTLPGLIPVSLSRSVERVLVEGNVLTATGAPAAVSVFAANGRQPVGVAIRGNDLSTGGGHGVVLESVRRCSVSDNVVSDRGSAGATGIGARGTSQALPVRDLRICGNVISGYDAAMRLIAGPGNVDGVLVTGNACSHYGVGGKVGLASTTAVGCTTTRVICEGNLSGEGIKMGAVGLPT